MTPTIAGIRAGRDELIEEAVRQIRGEGATPHKINESRRQKHDRVLGGSRKKHSDLRSWRTHSCVPRRVLLDDEAGGG